MPNYDFKCLSPYDFECLVRDLLQEELKVTIESFVTGKDNGIDLRYCKDAENELIIQAKHYEASGYSTLLSHLKSKELKKVKRLQPSRYILATSVGLTPKRKKEIKESFNPFIRIISDIYGKSDINNLLGKFPDIEKRNFKLWLTSKAVLDRVLHNDIYTQTDLEIQNIEKKIKYYVENKDLLKSRKLLEEQHYCVITGVPGVGKTTLAEILIIRYLARGYKLVKISNEISEAFQVYDPNIKQIFYYDDFLGQTSLNEMLAKNEDQMLLRFIESVKRSPGTRFILTTRDYILNKAKLVYEKLDKSYFDYAKYTISLTEYSEFDRAKILFNHLYFSDIPTEYKHELINNKSYMKIVKHSNFNPRIIEWMTQFIKVLGINPNEYVAEFIDNLDNPVKLWEHAFENQISPASRYLLLVLASLPTKVVLQDLQQAVIEFYKYKYASYGFNNGVSEFKKGLKELEGNFIKIENTFNSITVEFHNPSIRDFLEKYLESNNQEVVEILDSSIFFDQSVRLYKHLDDDRIETLIKSIERNFLNRECSIYFISTRKEYRKSAFVIETRILFILELWEVFRHERLVNIIDALLEILVDNLNEGDGIKGKIVEIYQRLLKNEILRGYQQEFEEAMKYFFTNDLNDLHDFDYILELSRINWRFLNFNEKEDLRYIFTEIYDGYLRELNVPYMIEDETSIIPDPDYLHNEGLLIEKIGNYFNVDVKEGLVKIETIISDLENMKPSSNEREDEWKLREAKSGQEQIESLFDTLLDL